MTMPPRMQASERGTTLQEGNKQQLVPEIPDDITLDRIVPRLPWKVFGILSCVSRAWLHGNRTRQVYDARVVSHSTQTLVVESFSTQDGTSISTKFFLCPVRADPIPPKPKNIQISPSCTELPSIQYYGSRWVCSDGYIYLIAAKNSFGRGCSNKVFVLDVAGKKEWKECARMNERRMDFGCGVMHGKLYVFGGLSTDRHDFNSSTFCGSEVYDPKEDCWSPIKPMTTLRYGHKVETVGDELFVHGGTFLDRHRFNAREMKDDDRSNVDSSDDEDNPWVGDSSDDDEEDDPWMDYSQDAKFLEIYHPVTDEWRVVNPFGRDTIDYLFAAGGKLYSLNGSSIHVYVGDNSWTHLHSFTLARPVLADSFVGKVYSAVVVDGELLVRAGNTRLGNTGNTSLGNFKSKGFGGESKEITWQKTPHFQIKYGSHPENSNHLIQL